MTPCISTGHDANSGGAPLATVSYGPLLFALPIADAGNPNTPDPSARWRYSLDISSDKPAARITVQRQPLQGKWDWPLASPLKLHADAVDVDWNPARRRRVCRPKPSPGPGRRSGSRWFPTAARSFASRCSP